MAQMEYEEIVPDRWEYEDIKSPGKLEMTDLEVN